MARLRLATFGSVWMCVVLVPAVALAQSTIAGTVRDSSGGVLPGVTVEVESPALIERVRTTATDGAGQYRIVDLRPGTYTVRFTLPGFNTVVREGLVLPADFVATVNIALSVGALEETITVTAESPMVDVQSSQRRQTLDAELLRALPTPGGYAGVMLLIPNMRTSGGNNPNVQLNAGMIVFGGQGGRGNEGMAQTDGIGTGAAINGGGVSGYGNMVTAQEVVLSNTAGLGDVEVGGPVVNLIPRTGGNTFQHHYYFSGMIGALQGDNHSQPLIDAGLARPVKNNYLVDTSYSVGGPFIRDRLWFYFNTRYRANGNDIAGMFHNKNAGDITKWLYEPDLSRPAKNSQPGTINPNLRLTMQLTERNRLGIFWDAGAYELDRYRPSEGSSTSAPETGGSASAESDLQQIKWTTTMTDRLLLEASYQVYHQRWNTRERRGNDPNLIRVQEQCAGGCPDNGNIPGLNYRAQNWSDDFMAPHRWHAFAMYVTGTHNAKVGYMGVFHHDTRSPKNNDHHLTYRFNNGVPNRLTQDLNPYTRDSRTRYDAVYAQDQWTRGRLTISGALRYDHAWSYYPEQGFGPTRWLPEPLIFPASKGVIGYHDISPRGSFAYDLFGDGNTAVKLHVGRYLEAAVNGNGNYSELQPWARVPVSVNRTWIDADGNFVPDCDLFNGAAQDLRASGGDFCGPWSNQNFGKEVFSLFYDEDILKGWGTRPADWQINATVQRQVFPRVSVEVGYTRRWLQNFTVTKNRAVEPSDFTKFDVVAPLDPRLPGGGGYVVEGIYNVNPDKFGQFDSYRTYAPNFGHVSHVYNGVDVNVSARLRDLQLRAGTSTGQTVVDTCDIRDKLPEQTLSGSSSTGGIPYSPTNPYCYDAPGITTRLTAVGSYVIPVIDAQFAATLTSSPGAPLQADWNIPNAVVRQWLGRDLAGNATNISVPLLAPGQMRQDRVNLLDLRVLKNIRLGGNRLQIGADVYNVFNFNTVINESSLFVPGGTWLRPTQVLTPRTMKLTVEYYF